MQVGHEVLGLDGVVYERSGRWWVAELPSFPGAYSQGRTKAEAYRNLLSAMRDIIDMYIAASRKRAPYNTVERKRTRRAGEDTVDLKAARKARHTGGKSVPHAEVRKRLRSDR